MSKADKQTLIYTALLCLLAWWLLRPKREGRVLTEQPQGINGLPQYIYTVPPYSALPGGVVPHGALFDWMNGDQCGCDGESTDTLINTVVIGARPMHGYNFVSVPSIPPALKAAPMDAVPPSGPNYAPIVFDPVPDMPPPPPITYQPPPKPEPPYHEYSWQLGNDGNLYLSFDDRKEWVRAQIDMKDTFEIYFDGAIYNSDYPGYKNLPRDQIAYKGTIYTWSGRKYK